MEHSCFRKKSDKYNVDYADFSIHLSCAVVYNFSCDTCSGKRGFLLKAGQRFY